MTTIATQIRELQGLTATQLAHRYAELFGKPPRVRNKAWLLRQCAWKLQERELGGLSERAKTRLEELIAKIDLPLGKQTVQSRPTSTPATRPTPLVGTTLVRRWHDQEIRVLVRDDGYEWNGILYSSLSAVARAVTGAGWSGALFFGLRNRRTGA